MVLCDVLCVSVERVMISFELENTSIVTSSFLESSTRTPPVRSAILNATIITSCRKPLHTSPLEIESSRKFFGEVDGHHLHVRVYVTRSLRTCTTYPAWLDAKPSKSRGSRCAASNRICTHDLHFSVLVVVLLVSNISSSSYLSGPRFQTYFRSKSCDHFAFSNRYGSYIKK